eukprot:5588417-Prymnesium_polylepis.1
MPNPRTPPGATPSSNVAPLLTSPAPYTLRSAVIAPSAVPNPAAGPPPVPVQSALVVTPRVVGPSAAAASNVVAATKGLSGSIAVIGACGGSDGAAAGPCALAPMRVNDERNVLAGSKTCEFKTSSKHALGVLPARVGRRPSIRS